MGEVMTYETEYGYYTQYVTPDDKILLTLPNIVLTPPVGTRISIAGDAIEDGITNGGVFVVTNVHHYANRSRLASAVTVDRHDHAE